MYSHGESHHLLRVFHSEKLSSDSEVTAAAYRKILCQSLKYAHEEGL
jgi:hypothetical protein